MDDDFINEKPWEDKYGPGEVNKPVFIMIPVSSIWNWFKNRKNKNKENKNANHDSDLGSTNDFSTTSE